MKLHFNKSFLRTLILTMVFSLSMTGVTFAQSNEKLDYVALGDSLAAGYTPTGTIDKSYTDFIAEKLDGEGVLRDYQNFGVVGNTTVQLLASINPYNYENTDRIMAIKNAEIITLDIGANDLIPKLLNGPLSPDDTNTAIVNIYTIIGTLKKLNPNAKIYIMSYYNASYRYYTEFQQQMIIPLIKAFNNAIQTVAVNTGATYVDTYESMDKHLAKYLPVVDIHPDTFGYRAIAKDFWNIIKVDFLRGMN